MKRFFLYITNNLEKSYDEATWDIIFLILMTIMFVWGVLLLYENEPGWVMLGGIWYLQAWDQIRNNREDI